MIDKPYEIDFYNSPENPYRFHSDKPFRWLEFFVYDMQNGEKISESQYLVIAYNELFLEKILENLQGQYQRFFVVYRRGGQEQPIKFFDWLVDKNYALHLETSRLERHAQESLEDSNWGKSPNPYASKITVDWHFENGIALSPDEAVFDERITLDWSWDCAGQRVHFRGYWYVTSFAFLRKRLDEIDPYYRRFTVICPRFDEAMLQRELQLFIDEDLAYINPTDLGVYLKYHCEVDGDINTYKR